MNCYYCELEAGPGGTHYGVCAAIGVCVDCGAALCSKHARSDGLGKPLGCPDQDAKREVPPAGRALVPA